MSGGLLFEIITAIFAVFGLYCALDEVKCAIFRALNRKNRKKVENSNDRNGR